jgi:hypothetical protein
MTEVHQYRVYCTTDSKVEYSWGETEPTTCPINAAHSIDSSQTIIWQTISEEKVQIKEEQISTGENFGATTITVNATKNVTTNQSVTWPHPISALAVEFISEDVHRGDIINLYVGKDTITGAITANVDTVSAWSSQNYTVGDIVTNNGRLYTCIVDTVSNEEPPNTSYWRHGMEINVEQTVIDNVAIGFYVSLFNGPNTDDLGRVLGVDKVNNKIYMETDPTNSYLAATPTYVRQSVRPIVDYELSGPWEHIIGANKIGGSYVPTDVAVTMTYENKSTDTDKTFVGQVEFLY